MDLKIKTHLHQYLFDLRPCLSQPFYLDFVGFLPECIVLIWFLPEAFFGAIMPSLDIVDFVLKWCYQNLSELVLVKQEDLFTYPAVNDLQQDFVNRFLDKNAFDSMIAGNKEDSVKKVTEINAFVAHCLRIVKEQGKFPSKLHLRHELSQ